MQAAPEATIFSKVEAATLFRKRMANQGHCSTPVADTNSGSDSQRKGKERDGASRNKNWCVSS